MLAAEEMGHKGVRAMTPLDAKLANELRTKLGKGRELPEEPVKLKRVAKPKAPKEDGAVVDGAEIVAKKPRAKKAKPADAPKRSPPRSSRPRRSSSRSPSRSPASRRPSSPGSRRSRRSPPAWPP